MRKSNKKNKQYWIDRGYSEQDAIQKSYEYNSGKLEYWLKRGFSEELSRQKIAEQYADNPEYWKKQGYSDEESLEYANVYGSTKTYCKKQYRFKSIEYWLALGYTKNDAVEKIKYYLSKNKRSIEYWIAHGLSKNDAKKKLLENNPTSKIYWISRGYSEAEACCEIRKRNEKFPEYWIAHGFSESDAIKKAEEVSDSANIMSKSYWMQLGYSEAKAEEKAKCETKRITKLLHANWDRSYNRLTVEYWVKRGYSVDEAKIKILNISRSMTKDIPFAVRSNAVRKGYANIPQSKKDKIHKEHSDYMKKHGPENSPCFKEYWINRGYSVDDAKKQAYLTRLGGRQKSGNLASKIETQFFDELSFYLDIPIIRQKWVTINDKAYCQDGRYKNIVFEFNGTRFHLDSRFYNESDTDPFGRTYENVHQKDDQKQNAYLQKQYNVIVIWEYDYLNYKEELFKTLKGLVETYGDESQIGGSYWSSNSLFNKR